MTGREDGRVADHRPLRLRHVPQAVAAGDRAARDVTTRRLQGDVVAHSRGVVVGVWEDHEGRLIELAQTGIAFGFDDDTSCLLIKIKQYIDRHIQTFVRNKYN